MDDYKIIIEQDHLTVTIQDKTAMLQDKGHILSLLMDNGQTKNIKLIDKGNVHNNHLQVINQFEAPNGTHSNRYDVTILVNGLPMVHVELKKRGVDIKEAFNQINRYQRDSFWAGKAMFDFVQIFVISNGTDTKYYSNTTRYAKEQEIFHNDKNAFLKTDISSLRKMTTIEKYSKELKGEYSILVFPEAYACLRPLTSKGKLPRATSLMIDIGGGTTDISFFTIV